MEAHGSSWRPKPVHQKSIKNPLYTMGARCGEASKIPVVSQRWSHPDNVHGRDLMELAEGE
jgi:hypothetical protein